MRCARLAGVGVDGVVLMVDDGSRSPGPGRRLLPPENPVTAAQRFGWLVRTIRAYHDDAEIRNTERFTARLNDHLQIPLKPATVGKLENGQVDFTVERCVAYERVLGIPDDGLLDVYIYQFRSQGLSPKSLRPARATVTARDLELLVRIAAQERLAGREWLEAASFLAANRALFTSKVTLDSFMTGLLGATRDAFERDWRLLREALILVGAPGIPYIVELASTEPMRFFNNIEVLGYLDHWDAMVSLVSLGRELDDSVLAQTLLEALRRRMRMWHLTFDDLPGTGRGIQSYCADLLSDPEEAYTAREEALGVLALPHAVVEPSRRARLAELRDDLDQLRVRPRCTTRQEVFGAVTDRVRLELEKAEAVPPGMPAQLPGLEAVLSASLFGATRIDRLSGAVLLSSFPFRTALSIALGEVLMERVDPQDYGLQRAMLRLMTKAGDSCANAYFTSFATTGIIDDNTRLTVAWALGGGGNLSDEAALAHLCGTSTTEVTKRVVVNSAARRGFIRLLTTAADSTASRVATEARKALQRLIH
jgi:hypothetical protein